MTERGGWREGAGWAHSCLQLQLGQILPIVLVLDAILILGGVYYALVAPDPSTEGIYMEAVLVPLVVLGIPSLADVIALERRAGCLDLALAAPSGELYFLRRAGVVVALLAMQACLVMALAWVGSDFAFPLVTVELQLLAVIAFTAATTLFWAVRLANPGAVWLASTGTLMAGGHWCFWLPVVAATAGARLLPSAWGIWDCATHAVPLLVVALLLLLYARRRLRRPEALLRAG